MKSCEESFDRKIRRGESELSHQSRSCLRIDHHVAVVLVKEEVTIEIVILIRLGYEIIVGTDVNQRLQIPKLQFAYVGDHKKLK